MLLPLLQLGDSALPVGGYSHSWGLEAAVHRGAVRDASSLEAWARRWLRHCAAPLEGVVVANACRAAAGGDWPAIAEANDLLAATLTAPTLRHASRDLGGQLLALAEKWQWAQGAAQALRRQAGENAGRDWHHAAVFGALACAGGATAGDAALLYLHQVALGVIGAAVRAVPVGHTHGQQLLARLHGELAELAANAATREPSEAGSYCPAYEEHCHAQSRLYTRLFRS